MALTEILLTLAKHRVRFIAVGGIAAVLRGAPIHTRDVDIVYDFADDNLDRLLAALDELNAVFRGDPRNLRPNRSHLQSRGHKLLQTRAGQLDVLGTIEESTEWADLVDDASAVDVAGSAIQVLTLDRLIEVKKQLSRPKDQLMLLQLESLRDELAKT